MKRLLQHPVVVQIRRLVQAAAVTCAVMLAAAIVTTVSVDLGPAAKAQIEEQGSRFLKRSLTIGRVSIRLWSGKFAFDDLVIGGPTPDAPPFLTARRITVSMAWRTLVDRRIVLDAVEMSDWAMVVESFPNGLHTFPSFTRGGPREPGRWTTTLEWVRAHRGQFTFIDHVTPWTVVARNIDVTVRRPGDQYVGEASFSNGTVTMQDYVPFGASMRAPFVVDEGRVIFDRMELATDGARTVLNGDVNLNHWPEMMYAVRSTIDFPTQKAIWFADDDFTAAGTGEFTGTFHLFRETMPDGTLRTGRELKGEIRSETAAVNELRFPGFQAQVRWTPELLAVTDARAGFAGGEARFDYRLAMGAGVRSKHRFDVTLRDVDLTTLARTFEVRGIEPAGRLSGRNLLEWPGGRFAEHTGAGRLTVTPPGGATVMAARMPLERMAELAARGARQEPFSTHTPREPVPIGGELVYTYGPDWLEIAAGTLATPVTFVEFKGRTAYGLDSQIAFHVSSTDWQESDREFAGVLTAFGTPTQAVEIGGYGTFDGLMAGAFRDPRIEGTFAGREMRAFDVVWGAVRGTAVIEDRYVEVTDVVVTSGDAAIETEGRYSLGYPRQDGGEELNARIRIASWPVADLRHAFELDEYDVDGLFSGEFRVYGNYRSPLGVGTMQITSGLAYGEAFDSATAGLRLEGDGVRLDNLRIVKGTGLGAGAAFVGWNGTYSFNLDARDVPVESLDAARASPQPLSGLVDLTAGGSGTFEVPRYEVRLTVRDFFVADEGIGQVIATLDVSGRQLTLRLEAASPRLAVSGAGRIALTPAMDAELTFSVADTSLDPYLRAFEPRLSPFTTAVASGTIRIEGELRNLDRLVVDATVDRLDVGLFDYALRNDSGEAGAEAAARRPIRLRLDRGRLRIADMRLVGEGTQLDVSGVVHLDEERLEVRATGDANLAVLQGLLSDVRSSGRARLSATLEGPVRDPLVAGTLAIDNGRIRHFDLPHALENISGSVELDSRGLSLDGLAGRIGGGEVRFGGRIDKEGYLPGRLDVTMEGRNMRLRLADGLVAYIDADLALQGTTDAAVLSGAVTLLEGSRYSREFDAAGGLFDLAGSVGAPAATVEPTLPLRYDLQITVPSTLQVRNSGMNVVASADLQLRGTYDRPLLFGRAEIERGEIRLEGKRYVVTRGAVDFNNPTRIEPFLDIEAEVRVRVPGETYRITVRVGGTLDRLAWSLDSDPPLPENDAIALLLGDIAPGQDVELRRYSAQDTTQTQLLRERAARALTGVVSSPVGRAVEQTFGVDTFQLTPSLVDPNQQSSRLEPGARLLIGKSLSERAYITYSRSLSATARDQILVLEYDQNDRLSWIFSRNEDGTYALDLRVRRTF